VEVKIIKWQNVMDHCEQDQIMMNAFIRFKEHLDYCDWEKPSDILRSFNHADIRSCKGRDYNRVIFNIGGNKYRMICGYKFGSYKVSLYVRFVGTHEAYDRVDVCSVNMF
jgi:mRNA interferase HigB